MNTRSTVISESRIPALDGLRGVAIISVMLGHFCYVLNAHDPIQRVIRRLAVSFGWTGVDLFFVLSGFLITGILLDAKVRDNYFRNFYARRVLRIFPLYYVGLLTIFFLFDPALYRWNWKANLGKLPYYLVYGQIWAHRAGLPLIGYFGSLAIEEQFYFVWPLVVYLLVPRRVLQVAIGGIIACNLLRPALLLHGVDYWTVYSNPFTRMDTILGGAVVACLIRERVYIQAIASKERWLIVAPLAALPLMHLSPMLTGGTPLIQRAAYPLVPLAYAGLLAAVVAGAGGTFRRFLRSALMRAAGKYSYSAYVWHALVRYIVPRVYPAANPLLKVTIMTGVSFAIAAASYAVIERPFLRLKRHFQTAAAPATEQLLLLAE